jgi:hypothetical protein
MYVWLRIEPLLPISPLFVQYFRNSPQPLQPIHNKLLSVIVVTCGSPSKLTRLGIFRRGFGSAEYNIPTACLGNRSLSKFQTLSAATKNNQANFKHLCFDFPSTFPSNLTVLSWSWADVWQLDFIAKTNGGHYHEKTKSIRSSRQFFRRIAAEIRLDCTPSITGRTPPKGWL